MMRKICSVLALLLLIALLLVSCGEVEPSVPEDEIAPFFTACETATDAVTVNEKTEILSYGIPHTTVTRVYDTRTETVTTTEKTLNPIGSEEIFTEKSGTAAFSRADLGVHLSVTDFDNAAFAVSKDTLTGKILRARAQTLFSLKGEDIAGDVTVKITVRGTRVKTLVTEYDTPAGNLTRITLSYTYAD